MHTPFIIVADPNTGAMGRVTTALTQNGLKFETMDGRTPYQHIYVVIIPLSTGVLLVRVKSVLFAHAGNLRFYFKVDGARNSTNLSRGGSLKPQLGKFIIFRLDMLAPPAFWIINRRLPETYTFESFLP